MPRRSAATVRPTEPDPLHRSKLVQQVINRVMLDGKKSVSYTHLTLPTICSV